MTESAPAAVSLPLVAPRDVAPPPAPAGVPPGTRDRHLESAATCRPRTPSAWQNLHPMWCSSHPTW
eukprot:27342-Pyramimonas_sp.AAC.1